MNYGYTIIYVESVERVINFYRNAFGFELKFITESKDYGELRTGETTLAFASHHLGESNVGRDYFRISKDGELVGYELAFVAEDVSAAYKNALAAGAEPLRKPTQKPWGQTVGYVRGIDGSIIEICSQIDE